VVDLLCGKLAEAMSHARLGLKALWYCPGCFVQQRPGSFACRHCCGYTGKRANVCTDVRNAFGRPSKRVPS
jgi:hypothetical protein